MLTLLCSVSVNLAELRRVLEMKEFWFMDEIVTDGVGHLRTYGPRGQVKGGRWPSDAPNPLRGECSKEELLTQRSLRVGRGAQKKGIKVGLDAKWGGFKVWI